MAKNSTPSTASGTVRRLYNLSELASLLGRDYKTIISLTKRPGFPVPGEGGKGVARMVDVSEVVHWLEAEAEAKGRGVVEGEDPDARTREQAEVRKANAQADLFEEKLRILRASLIPIALAEQAILVSYGSILRAIDGVATRIAADFPGDRRSKTAAADWFVRETHDAISKVTVTLPDILRGAQGFDDVSDDTEEASDAE